MSAIEKVTVTTFENLPEVEVLALALFSDEELPPIAQKLDEENQGLLSKARQSKDFTGKLNSTILVFLPNFSKSSRCLLVGLGKKEDFSSDKARQAAASAARAVLKLQVENMALTVGADELNTETAQAVAEGLVMGSYRFTEYKTKRDDDEDQLKELKEAWLVTSQPLNAAVEYGLYVAEQVNFARDLGNQPSNVATPAYLAAKAQEIAQAPNMRCIIYEREDFEKLGFGGLQAVSAGSARDPKFIILEYRGGGPDARHLGLVGKGLTFDSGGISIKPAAGMDEMKFDMLGGAAVLAVMRGVAARQPKINITAIVPATENMSGAAAYKPGDILKAYNGKTIEVLNTDAEGRLVLADALAYITKNYKLEGVLDFATLTGAVIIALGHRYSGLLTNHDTFAAEVMSVAEDTQDRVWRLPLDDEYREDVKSKIADVKNVGAKRSAGTIAGGAFLWEFVESDTPWCHIDIAGTGWQTKGRPYNPDGPSGAGVRLTLELIRRWSE